MSLIGVMRSYVVILATYGWIADRTRTEEVAVHHWHTREEGTS